MTKFHHNFLDLLTDHEKHMSDRQTECSDCARRKATPGATGKAPPECEKLHVFHTDQSLMNISHSPPNVPSLVIPVYPRFTLTVSTCNSVMHSHGRHQICPCIVHLSYGSSTPQKINFSMFTLSTDGLFPRKSKFIVKVFIRLKCTCSDFSGQCSLAQARAKRQ